MYFMQITLPIITVRVLLSLLLLPILAIAEDEFAVEQAFDLPVTIPTQVITYLNANKGPEIHACGIEKTDDAFEATVVKLAKKTQAFLVKPRAWCLCGVQNCPVWFFEIHGKQAKQVLFDNVSSLTIHDNQKNGYRQMTTFSSHGSETNWVWAHSEYRKSIEKIRT